VLGTNLGATANEEGAVEIRDIPPGDQRIQFSFTGYQQIVVTAHFPARDSTAQDVRLHPMHESLEEIVISSTRGTRTIADIPTRVELIAGEELDEKGNMKPGDIRMLLNESTGVHTQQTSATSGNASIRIQGLDGRYTQILKDGFPLYSGFSGGLGLLQTPPLDLKQVEVIKGSSSTLYGGGAIAGLVNLISRVPQEQRDLSFMVNGTTAGGLDVSGFYGQKFRKTGVTLFASRNLQAPYAPKDVDFTAIPKFERYSINPQVWLDFAKATSLRVGIQYTSEDRTGGDINFVKGDGDQIHRYFERNQSRRYSTQVSLTHRVNSKTTVSFRNSLNHFNRRIEIPAYRFGGIQNSSFSELNFVNTNERMEWIAGFNLWTDNFSEERLLTNTPRDYQQVTFGAFVQNDLKISPAFRLETGLRVDDVRDYGLVLLPRLSLLFKRGYAFSSRIGSGFGYKSPNVFTEESERIQYRNVLLVSGDRNRLEKSYGLNWDLNYRVASGGMAFTVNHLFFYTLLDDPLMLIRQEGGAFAFENLSGFMDTRGIETNVKLELGDFRLFVGYTFTDARIHDGVKAYANPLTPRHRLNNVLMYEVEEKWKVGLEAYYFSPQALSDGTKGTDYWICGLMLEKIWEKFSLFANFENFLDTRQTRFDTIYTGTVTDPVFRDIYAPLDGFIVNGGVKLKL
jgi:iron complex outermembrane receptor protein